MAKQHTMVSSKRVAAVCFALFLFAGYYKAADLLQFVAIDLTLLFCAATAGFCVLALWRQRRLPPGSIPMLVVFLAMAMGLHWPEGFGTYPVQKELRLFSLTALSAFAPLLLLQERDERAVFVYAITLLGAVMAAAALFQLVGSASHMRTGVFNTNPILLARASGFALLVLCLLYWQGRIGRWIFTPAAIAVLLGLLVSSSRGPLVAVLVTTVTMVPLSIAVAQSRPRVWGTVLVGAAGVAVAVFYLSLTRTYLLRRLLRLLTGEWGDTEVLRWTVWRQTLDVIAGSPLGIGWGRLGDLVQVYYKDTLLINYPHNIVLEIWAEAGWLAGAAFVVVVGKIFLSGFRQAYRAESSATDPASLDRIIVFIAPVYWFACAFFSGDVNDNRPLWAMLGMALAAQGFHEIRGFAYAGNIGRSSNDENDAS